MIIAVSAFVNCYW